MLSKLVILTIERIYYLNFMVFLKVARRDLNSAMSEFYLMELCVR